MARPEAPNREQISQDQAIILATGERSEKLVLGHPALVIPFVGTDTGGFVSSLGVGAMYPQKRNLEIWGLILPHNLIQSYRAMRLLEGLPAIENDTLSACWSAATRDIRPVDSPRLDELSRLFPDYGQINLRAIITRIVRLHRRMKSNVGPIRSKQFVQLQQKILNDTPTAQELERMIQVLTQAGVHLNVYEIYEEIEAGRVLNSDRLKELLIEQEDMLKRMMAGDAPGIAEEDGFFGL
ncbi:hypothetical protein A3C25_03930 [Candidatus Roizmanbacteria bacterium RIFCSPHIGHO2_02_FULL_38_11]|uniref:Uncharacterized protein n=1 Tax=Candidatus Roizmanbacteria bacterium RIFCSPHIGHO2_02_FULL_38_11 TaxID=1802039 RepID=A0A1F7H0A8_9BACT|nr:MAG: hypothetical protein A3C25_03930 [Candidatus Roizmanbacteria bacterium RIFCSPHIGHO2_02_FULL_38_11]